jgi:hypothetical protein
LDVGFIEISTIAEPAFGNSSLESAVLKSVDVAYTQQFFELQLSFASRVATLSKMPLDWTLLNCTNLYVRFGLGRQFDAAHPIWQEYLLGLARSTDHPGWTFKFYQACLPDRGQPPVVSSVGCFSYARLGTDSIRLHFQNAEVAHHSPLAANRSGHRFAELRALFEEVRRNEERSPRVVGASWLYNLEAYRKLFPHAYLATATTARPRLQNMSLWGQFLDRHGTVRQQLALPFLQRLSLQKRLDELAQCFPYQALALDAPASSFYDFYERQHDF